MPEPTEEEQYWVVWAEAGNYDESVRLESAGYPSFELAVRSFLDDDRGLGDFVIIHGHRTPDEQFFAEYKTQREPYRLEEERKRLAQWEQNERAEYERLKQKFEGAGGA